MDVENEMKFYGNLTSENTRLHLTLQNGKLQS